MLLAVIVGLLLIAAGVYLLTHYGEGLARFAGGALIILGLLLILFALFGDELESADAAVTAARSAVMVLRSSWG